jgi:hypothetical protein
MPELGDDERREQRHDGDEQSGGGAVDVFLGMPEQEPRHAHFDDGEGEQPLPFAKGGCERIAMQCDGQQQQRAHERARTCHHEWVDFAHGDANEEVGHAP